jgi:hypothetical protein
LTGCDGSCPKPVNFAVDRVRSVFRNGGEEADDERVQGAGGDDPGKQSPLVSNGDEPVAGWRNPPSRVRQHTASEAPAPAIAAKVMFLGLPCGKLVPTIPAAAGEATAKPAPASARANPSPMIFWWGQTCYSKGAVLTGMKPLMAIQTVQNVIPSRYAERRP